MSMTFEELHAFGRSIDDAEDAGNLPKLEALDLQAVRYVADETSQFTAYVWYFRSNIHSAIQTIHGRQSWKWRQPHRERQILYLRRAINHKTFLLLPEVMQASILVNLGNSLSAFGRGLEAIELYDSALELVPKYAMAQGNRGEAMYALLPSIPDSGHASLLAAYAHLYLEATQAEDANWENGNINAKPHYKTYADHIATKINPAQIRLRQSLNEFSLGQSKAEQDYRRWSLRHNLFLNPLNALGNVSIAATDRMNLPSHITPIIDPPQYIAWFNQMKQEYIGARWFLYEGTRLPKRHFADRERYLVNTLDYPAFSLQSEKLRTAFRLAYGLLDKVAGFVNTYYGLGIDAKRVDLRSVWRDKKVELRPEFVDKKNLALRGLYWLALDIIGDDPADQDSIAPEATELKRIRNLLEHRSLVIREMGTASAMGAVETIILSDFERHALHILKLARAALMYLAFSMRLEEQTRSASDTSRAAPIELPLL